MQDKPLFILMVLCLGLVVVVLATGIGGFARGGAFNRKYANKIMRLRIIAQAAAIGLILLFVALTQG